jgi:hypothetical protein
MVAAEDGIASPGAVFRCLHHFVQRFDK